MIPPPKRKKKCQACGNYVYVRTLPETREKAWVTEEVAQHVDDRWTEFQMRKESEVQGIIEIIGKRNFDNQVKQFRDSNPLLSFPEIVWRIFLSIKDKADSLLLVSMASYAFNAGYRDRYLQLSTEAHRKELHQYESDGIMTVEILSGECSACKKLQGVTLSITQALETMPLPCKECTTYLEPDEINADHIGYCRCCYAPVVSINDISGSDRPHKHAISQAPSKTARTNKQIPKSGKSLRSIGCTVLLILLVIWLVIAVMVRCSLSS